MRSARDPHWRLPRKWVGKCRGGKARRMNQRVKGLIRLRDNFTCQICGEWGKEVDHIKPYADGGRSVPKNLRVLCVKCNRATRRPQYNARLPLNEYYQALERELVLA